MPEYIALRSLCATPAGTLGLLHFCQNRVTLIGQEGTHVSEYESIEGALEDDDQQSVQERMAELERRAQSHLIVVISFPEAYIVGRVSRMNAEICRMKFVAGQLVDDEFTGDMATGISVGRMEDMQNIFKSIDQEVFEWALLEAGYNEQRRVNR